MIVALLAAASLTLPPVPGDYNHQVTRTTTARTVCVRGWSSTVRPSYPDSERYKRTLLAGRPASAFQLDHLVSLSLGGAATRRDFVNGEPTLRARRNLWLQPIAQARADDVLEGLWHRELCSGKLTLREARRAELRWKRAHG